MPLSRIVKSFFMNKFPLEVKMYIQQDFQQGI